MVISSSFEVSRLLCETSNLDPADAVFIWQKMKIDIREQMNWRFWMKPARPQLVFSFMERCWGQSCHMLRCFALFLRWCLSLLMLCFTLLALLCLCFAFALFCCALLFFATSNAKGNAKGIAKGNARDNAKDNTRDPRTMLKTMLEPILSHVTVFCSLSLVMP